MWTLPFIVKNLELQVSNSILRTHQWALPQLKAWLRCRLLVLLLGYLGLDMLCAIHLPSFFPFSIICRGISVDNDSYLSQFSLSVKQNCWKSKNRVSCLAYPFWKQPRPTLYSQPARFIDPVIFAVSGWKGVLCLPETVCFQSHSGLPQKHSVRPLSTGYRYQH